VFCLPLKSIIYKLFPQVEKATRIIWETHSFANIESEFSIFIQGVKMKNHINIFLSFLFIVVVWFIYYKYPYVLYFFFALIISIALLIVIERNNILHAINLKNQERTLIDLSRAVFTGVTFMVFLTWFSISINYGGSAASNIQAMKYYDAYEIGKYYIVNHGNYTEVPYKIWSLLKNTKTSMTISFSVGIVWNVIYKIKTEGYKSLIVGIKRGISR